MLRRYTSFALALAVGALSPCPGRAQGTGTTAGILLELPATARTLGLGGAYSSVGGDEGSVFVNPAGLAPIRHLAVGGSYQRAFFGSTLSTGAVALRVGRFDLGFGLEYLDYGSDSVVVPDPAFGGDRGMATGEMISAYDALAVGAIAWRRGLLSLGGSVKYLRERIAAGGSAVTTSGVGVDLGLAAALFDIAALGVVVQNLGGDLKTSVGPRAPLPRTTRVGFSINIVDPQGTLRLLSTTDWVKPRAGESYWAFGVEGGVVSHGVGVLGRAGLEAGRPASDRKGLVYGGSLVFHSLQIDYGYQGYDVTGASAQRIGVRWIP